MTMISNTKWSRALKFAATPILLASLAACAASPFRSDVTRFESQLPAPQGQSFAVVADDPALQGGLEFSQYAEYVADQMARLGYTPAASPEDATLLVRFDYGIDDGREVLRRTGFRDPFYDSWYGYPRYRAVRTRSGRIAYIPTRRWGYGWRDPFFARDDVVSTTVFVSDIELKIDEAATGRRLFEGSAEAASRSKRLQYLVPNLVEAMFTDFPGNSGETVRISVAPEDMPVKQRR